MKYQLSQLSNEEKVCGIVIFVLASIALFVNLGVHPLRDEEPRRAFVALEMLFRSNYIVPTELGEYYYNKPPLFNWIIILSFQLFGAYSELAIRFFSVLSVLLNALLVFLLSRKYVGLRFGVYSALFFLATIHIVFYFSITGEIDLFYTLITTACLLSIFHFEQQNSYYKLFVISYILAALGTLTKGLPSIAFMGITLLVYFAYRKKFLKLFSPAHFVGIGTFILIVGGYFFWYSQYADPVPYLMQLFRESSQRTVVESRLFSFFRHLFTYPFQALVDMMPYSLLLVFAFRKGFINTLQQNSLVAYAALVFIANVILYWLSPGASSRYLCPLYPYFAIVMTYYWLTDTGEKKQMLFEKLILLLIVLVILAGLALPFIDQIAVFISSIRLISLVTVSGGVVVFWVYRKYASLRMMSLLLLVFWIRFIFDLTVLPIRAQSGRDFRDKQLAYQIMEIVGDQPLHVWGEGSRPPRVTSFYLERARGEVLGFTKDINPNAYYIVFEEHLAGRKYDSLLNFEDLGIPIRLVKFKPE